MLHAHVAYYLRNLFWPFEMRALPAFEPASGLLEAGVLAGLAVVVASLALAAALWRRQPVASFAILAYWTLFLPTSSVQPFRFLVLDYRQYPSLAFACLLAALALGHLPRPASAALIGVLTVYFGASTYGINATWRTQESFWEQSVRHGTLPMGHVAYARAIEERAPDLAEKHYRVALEAEPRNVYAFFNLAFLYIRLDRGEEGLRLARRAVDSAPDWAFSHFWLARAYRDLGRTAEAAASSRQAAARDPKNVEYQYEAALDMQELGHYAESLRYLQRVTDRSPGYRHSVHAEGRALHELGRWTDAEQRYRDSLSRHPTYGLGWLDLGRGLGEQDRCPEALEALEEALRLGVEETAAAHRWLARCYAAGGDAEAAARHAAAADDDPENR